MNSLAKTQQTGSCMGEKEKLLGRETAHMKISPGESLKTGKYKIRKEATTVISSFSKISIVFLHLEIQKNR